MSASYSPSYGKKVSAEDKVVLNVLLNCEETKSSKTKQIHFKSLPTTSLEIKKKIEEDFSIPSCVQALHYQSMILKDSDQLQCTHFRSGDTFTIDYPTEAECELTQNVIKWLKELYELLKCIKESISSADEKNDLSITCQKVENMITEGVETNTIAALYTALFFPWEEKKKLMNKFYFQQEGGVDMLMKVYGILVSKKWGELGIDKEFHIYLERVCPVAIANYVQTFALRRHVVRLGGLEMCTTTLLRRQLLQDEHIPDTILNILYSGLNAICSLSELPECHVPLAKRTDVIDQALDMALHPASDCLVSIASASMILCLSQSPEAHSYIVRKEVIEKMLEMCEQKHRIINEQSSQSHQGKKENPMAVIALKGYISTVLAQVGLGSPHLLLESIPPHLVQQILNLMSDMLEAASPADIRQYEEKEGLVWGTFLPYLQYLYKPSTAEEVTTKNSVGDIKTNLYVGCCNVLLHVLESTLGRDLHLEILLKEGLLDYAMCLPAVLPGECQPRARSLVNELSKHRQLQPPSLCTLAKAHIAKIFCGLQPVMEMNSIGEFVYKYLPSPANI